MPSAEIADDDGTDRPRVREMVIGAQLNQARTIIKISVDKACELEPRDEGVVPIGSQEQPVPAQLLLLVQRIAADEPELTRDRRGRAGVPAGAEPVVPVRPRETGLVEMVFEVERDLRCRRVSPDREFVLKAPLRILRQDTRCIWRKSPGIPAEAEGIVDEARTSATGPFEVGDDALAHA